MGDTVDTKRTYPIVYDADEILQLADLGNLDDPKLGSYDVFRQSAPIRDPKNPVVTPDTFSMTPEERNNLLRNLPRDFDHIICRNLQSRADKEGPGTVADVLGTDRYELLLVYRKERQKIIETYAEMAKAPGVDKRNVEIQKRQALVELEQKVKDEALGTGSVAPALSHAYSIDETREVITCYPQWDAAGNYRSQDKKFELTVDTLGQAAFDALLTYLKNPKFAGTKEVADGRTYYVMQDAITHPSGLEKFLTDQISNSSLNPDSTNSVTLPFRSSKQGSWLNVLGISGDSSTDTALAAKEARAGLAALAALEYLREADEVDFSKITVTFKTDVDGSAIDKARKFIELLTHGPHHDENYRTQKSDIAYKGPGGHSVQGYYFNYGEKPEDTQHDSWMDSSTFDALMSVAAGAGPRPVETDYDYSQAHPVINGVVDTTKPKIQMEWGTDPSTLFSEKYFEYHPLLVKIAEDREDALGTVLVDKIIDPNTHQQISVVLASTGASGGLFNYEIPPGYRLPTPEEISVMRTKTSYMERYYSDDTDHFILGRTKSGNPLPVLQVWLIDQVPTVQEQMLSHKAEAVGGESASKTETTDLFLTHEQANLIWDLMGGEVYPSPNKMPFFRNTDEDGNMHYLQDGPDDDAKMDEDGLPDGYAVRQYAYKVAQNAEGFRKAKDRLTRALDAAKIERNDLTVDELLNTEGFLYYDRVAYHKIRGTRAPLPSVMIRVATREDTAGKPSSYIEMNARSAVLMEAFFDKMLDRYAERSQEIIERVEAQEAFSEQASSKGEWGLALQATLGFVGTGVGIWQLFMFRRQMKMVEKQMGAVTEGVSQDPLAAELEAYGKNLRTWVAQRFPDGVGVVGREEELLTILRILARKEGVANSIAFTGPAGVGKSYLAYWFAEILNLIEDKPKLEDKAMTSKHAEMYRLLLDFINKPEELARFDPETRERITARLAAARAGTANYGDLVGLLEAIVPEDLKGATFFELDPLKLTSGTAYRGQFEAKMLAFINSLKEANEGLFKGKEGILFKMRLARALGHAQKLDQIYRKYANNPAYGDRDPVTGEFVLDENKLPWRVRRSARKSREAYGKVVDGLMGNPEVQKGIQNQLGRAVAEARANGRKVIIFIDEVHSTVGAGTTREGGADFWQILKPYLATGEITLMCASTNKEIKVLMSDPAIARRVTEVYVGELSKESINGLMERTIRETIEYRGRMDPFEARLPIDDSALRAKTNPRFFDQLYAEAPDFFEGARPASTNMLAADFTSDFIMRMRQSPYFAEAHRIFEEDLKREMRRISRLGSAEARQLAEYKIRQRLLHEFELRMLGWEANEQGRGSDVEAAVQRYRESLNDFRRSTRRTTDAAADARAIADAGHRAPGFLETVAKRLTKDNNYERRLGDKVRSAFEEAKKAAADLAAATRGTRPRPPSGGGTGGPGIRINLGSRGSSVDRDAVQKAARAYYDALTRLMEELNKFPSDVKYTAEAVSIYDHIMQTRVILEAEHPGNEVAAQREAERLDRVHMYEMARLTGREAQIAQARQAYIDAGTTSAERSERESRWSGSAEEKAALRQASSRKFNDGSYNEYKTRKPIKRVIELQTQLDEAINELITARAKRGAIPYDKKEMERVHTGEGDKVDISKEIERYSNLIEAVKLLSKVMGTNSAFRDTITVNGVTAVDLATRLMQEIITGKTTDERGKSIDGKPYEVTEALYAEIQKLYGQAHVNFEAERNKIREALNARRTRLEESQINSAKTEFDASLETLLRDARIEGDAAQQIRARAEDTLRRRAPRKLAEIAADTGLPEAQRSQLRMLLGKLRRGTGKTAAYDPSPAELLNDTTLSKEERFLVEQVAYQESQRDIAEYRDRCQSAAMLVADFPPYAEALRAEELRLNTAGVSGAARATALRTFNDGYWANSENRESAAAYMMIVLRSQAPRTAAQQAVFETERRNFETFANRPEFNPEQRMRLRMAFLAVAEAGLSESDAAFAERMEQWRLNTARSAEILDAQPAADPAARAMQIGNAVNLVVGSDSRFAYQATPAENNMARVRYLLGEMRAVPGITAVQLGELNALDAALWRDAPGENAENPDKKAERLQTFLNDRQNQDLLFRLRGARQAAAGGDATQQSELQGSADTILAELRARARQHLGVTEAQSQAMQGLTQAANQALQGLDAVARAQVLADLNEVVNPRLGETEAQHLERMQETQIAIEGIAEANDGSAAARKQVKEQVQAEIRTRAGEVRATEAEEAAARRAAGSGSGGGSRGGGTGGGGGLGGAGGLSQSTASAESVHDFMGDPLVREMYDSEGRPRGPEGRDPRELAGRAAELGLQTVVESEGDPKERRRGEARDTAMRARGGEIADANRPTEFGGQRVGWGSGPVASDEAPVPESSRTTRAQETTSGMGSYDYLGNNPDHPLAKGDRIRVPDAGLMTPGGTDVRGTKSGTTGSTTSTPVLETKGGSAPPPPPGSGDGTAPPPAPPSGGGGGSGDDGAPPKPPGDGDGTPAAPRGSEPVAGATGETAAEPAATRKTVGERWTDYKQDVRTRSALRQMDLTATPEELTHGVHDEVRRGEIKKLALTRYKRLGVEAPSAEILDATISVMEAVNSPLTEAQLMGLTPQVATAEINVQRARLQWLLDNSVGDRKVVEARLRDIDALKKQYEAKNSVILMGVRERPPLGAYEAVLANVRGSHLQGHVFMALWVVAESSIREMTSPDPNALHFCTTVLTSGVHVAAFMGFDKAISYSVRHGLIIPAKGAFTVILRPGLSEAAVFAEKSLAARFATGAGTRVLGAATGGAAGIIMEGINYYFLEEGDAAIIKSYANSGNPTLEGMAWEMKKTTATKAALSGVTMVVGNEIGGVAFNAAARQVAAMVARRALAQAAVAAGEAALAAGATTVVAGEAAAAAGGGGALAAGAGGATVMSGGTFLVGMLVVTALGYAASKGWEYMDEIYKEGDLIDALQNELQRLNSRTSFKFRETGSDDWLSEGRKLEYINDDAGFAATLQMLDTKVMRIPQFVDLLETLDESQDPVFVRNIARLQARDCTLLEALDVLGVKHIDVDIKSMTPEGIMGLVMAAAKVGDGDKSLTLGKVVDMQATPVGVVAFYDIKIDVQNGPGTGIYHDSLMVGLTQEQALDLQAKVQEDRDFIKEDPIFVLTHNFVSGWAKYEWDKYQYQRLADADGHLKAEYNDFSLENISDWLNSTARSENPIYLDEEGVRRILFMEDGAMRTVGRELIAALDRNHARMDWVSAATEFDDDSRSIATLWVLEQLTQVNQSRELGMTDLPDEWLVQNYREAVSDALYKDLGSDEFYAMTLPDEIQSMNDLQLTGTDGELVASYFCYHARSHPPGRALISVDLLAAVQLKKQAAAQVLSPEERQQQLDELIQVWHQDPSLYQNQSAELLRWIAEEGEDDARVTAAIAIRDTLFNANLVAAEVILENPEIGVTLTRAELDGLEAVSLAFADDNSGTELLQQKLQALIIAVAHDLEQIGILMREYHDAMSDRRLGDAQAKIGEIRNLGYESYAAGLESHQAQYQGSSALPAGDVPTVQGDANAIGGDRTVPRLEGESDEDYIARWIDTWAWTLYAHGVVQYLKTGHKYHELYDEWRVFLRNNGVDLAAGSSIVDAVIDEATERMSQADETPHQTLRAAIQTQHCHDVPGLQAGLREFLNQDIYAMWVQYRGDAELSKRRFNNYDPPPKPAGALKTALDDIGRGASLDSLSIAEVDALYSTLQKTNNLKVAMQVVEALAQGMPSTWRSTLEKYIPAALLDNMEDERSGAGRITSGETYFIMKKLRVAAALEILAPQYRRVEAEHDVQDWMATVNDLDMIQETFKDDPDFSPSIPYDILDDWTNPSTQDHSEHIREFSENVIPWIAMAALERGVDPKNFEKMQDVILYTFTGYDHLDFLLHARIVQWLMESTEKLMKDKRSLLRKVQDQIYDYDDGLSELRRIPPPQWIMDDFESYVSRYPALSPS